MITETTGIEAVTTGCVMNRFPFVAAPTPPSGPRRPGRRIPIARPANRPGHALLSPDAVLTASRRSPVLSLQPVQLGALRQQPIRFHGEPHRHPHQAAQSSFSLAGRPRETRRCVRIRLTAPVLALAGQCQGRLVKDRQPLPVDRIDLDRIEQMFPFPIPAGVDKVPKTFFPRDKHVHL